MSEALSESQGTAPAPAPPQVYATTYDRADCRVGVVHLGYGSFHRAHQAVYFDDYMEKTGDLGWGIAAVNLHAADSAAFAATSGAGGGEGYILKTTTPDGEHSLRRVRPHLLFSDWHDDREATEALLARPEVRAVTVTVTESGYCIDDKGDLDESDPAINAEINGGEPHTIYGYLAAALERRMNETDAAAVPLTILCCDNIRSNGAMLRRNLFRYLKLNNLRLNDGDALWSWIDDNVSFPCSVVDRITPGVTREGFVHSEDYTQWTVEGDSSSVIAGLRRAGVKFVRSVEPHEEMKIRVLNGGHTALAYLGVLAGYATFDAAMRDAVLRHHFNGWIEEVHCGLTLSAPRDREAYSEKVAARFCNASIADSLDRICMDGFSKFRLFINPTLESCLRLGVPPVCGYACIGSWYVYARRYAAGGSMIKYRESQWSRLAPLLDRGREEDFARLSLLWGDLPEKYSQFAPSVVAAIKETEAKWPV
ncbi:MAG: mannitol dehydrogenase family protein [Alphaproteobacteria bacterium]|nr:mannitol dehydrogenase family protein [Alphaproteobacteria bacterium]MDA8003779.1 mannitol dehydrogenase family protein [Alphaproteobacteria bacterium]MDA8005123.1 mannitol dehydrogenase family protein [Alphaproteobacteria bacterium]MDA8013337.1 mannitol dehydrogenase family protein [Alphaproteobacteria bacterium]